MVTDTLKCCVITVVTLMNHSGSWCSTVDLSMYPHEWEVRTFFGHLQSLSYYPISRYVQAIPLPKTCSALGLLNSMIGIGLIPKCVIPDSRVPSIILRSLYLTPSVCIPIMFPPPRETKLLNEHGRERMEVADLTAYQGAQDRYQELFRLPILGMKKHSEELNDYKAMTPNPDPSLPPLFVNPPPLPLLPVHLQVTHQSPNLLYWKLALPHQILIRPYHTVEIY